MDTINQFFQTLFQIALCASPFIVIGAIIAGVVLYNNHSKQQRRERWTAALQGVSGLYLPELDSIPAPDKIPDILFARELGNCAQLLSGVTKGDLNIFEQKSLEKFIQALQAYRQQAAFGTLPNPELDQLRLGELHRLDSLSTAISHISQAAEAGDASTLKQYMVDASQPLAAAYDGHVGLLQKMKEADVAFPIQPPAPIVPTSTGMIYAESPELVPMQILQQLPEDKRAFYMMQYTSVRKTPSTAVLLAILLGGVGAHKFYLGQVGLGILYLLFSWTWVPMILGIIEAFTISGYVNRYNAQKALEVAALFGAAGPR